MRMGRQVILIRLVLLTGSERDAASEDEGGQHGEDEDELEHFGGVVRINCTGGQAVGLLYEAHLIEVHEWVIRLEIAEAGMEISCAWTCGWT